MTSPLLLNRRNALKLGLGTGIGGLLGLRAAPAEDATTSQTPAVPKETATPRIDPVPWLMLVSRVKSLKMSGSFLTAGSFLSRI